MLLKLCSKQQRRKINKDHVYDKYKFLDFNKATLYVLVLFREGFMSLNFFSSKPKDDNGKRYRAVNTVRTFLWGRTHLPKELILALKFLITELNDRNNVLDE